MATVLFDGKPIRDYDGYLAKANALPQNTSAYAVEGAYFLGNTNGALRIQTYVTTAWDLTDTKIATIDLYDSADGITYAKFVTLYTLTAAAGNGIILAGVKLGDDYVIPPDCNDYVKLYLTTDDADVVGAIDTTITYLSR